MEERSRWPGRDASLVHAAFFVTAEPTSRVFLLASPSPMATLVLVCDVESPMLLPPKHVQPDCMKLFFPVSRTWPDIVRARIGCTDFFG